MPGKAKMNESNQNTRSINECWIRQIILRFLLTHGLWNIAGIDAQGDVTLGQVLVFMELVLLVQLVQHFHATIFHDLLAAVGGEAKLENLWGLGVPLNKVLTLVVIVEGLAAEHVPVWIWI